MVYVATGGGEGADPWWLHASTAGTGGNFRGAQPSALSTTLAMPFTSLFTSLTMPSINIPELNLPKVDIPEWMFRPADIGLAALGLNGKKPKDDDLNNGGGTTNRFLTYLGLALLGLAAAPVVYRAANRPRRGKRYAGQDDVALSLDNASNRVTTILSSMAPVLAFPIAYIGIDELENRGVISGKLGDDVQGLMTMMASASLLGPLGSLIKSVV